MLGQRRVRLLREAIGRHHALDASSTTRSARSTPSRAKACSCNAKDWDLPKHIRISYGLQDQNEAVIKALKKTL